MHVSIPRYRARRARTAPLLSSRRAKGFLFVEYRTAEEAAKAIESLDGAIVEVAARVHNRTRHNPKLKANRQFHGDGGGADVPGAAPGATMPAAPDVRVQERFQPRVMSKLAWSQAKAEFKAALAGRTVVDGGVGAAAAPPQKAWRGVFVRVAGLPVGATHDAIRDAVEAVVPIEYLDYKPSQHHAIVRVQSSHDAAHCTWLLRCAFASSLPLTPSARVAARLLVPFSGFLFPPPLPTHRWVVRLCESGDWP